MNSRINSLILVTLLAEGHLTAVLSAHPQFQPQSGKGKLAWPPPSSTLGKVQIEPLKIQGIEATQDQQGFMWFISQNGLYRYDGYSYIHYRHDPLDSTSISYPRLECLYVDRNGILWVGSYGGGLNRYNRETDTFTRYRHKKNDPNSLSHDEVTAILEDRHGMLWVGTHGGLNRFDRQTGAFTRYSHDPSNSASLSCDQARVLYEDRQGTLWIGTGEPDISAPLRIKGGLNRFDPQTRGFVRYLHDPADPTSLVHDQVLSLCEDSRGNFWVGTMGDGLHTVDRKRGTFTRFRYDPANPLKLSAPFLEGTQVVPEECNGWLNCGGVTFIHEDRYGMLWIGRLGCGINRYDPQAGALLHYEAATSGLSDNFIWRMYESHDGTLWIGTWLRTHKLITSITAFPLHLPHPANANAGLQLVTSLLEDRKGMMWIATWGNGVVRIDRSTGAVTEYRHDPNDPNSLGNNIVPCLYEDRSGALWIGSGGIVLSRYDGATKRFTHFRHDPLNPATIKENKLGSPKMVLTGLRILNNEVTHGPTSPLREPLYKAREITLSYDQNDFTIDYTGLSYHTPEKNRYYYKLEPRDADWVNSYAQRSARYSGLSPGTYVFRARAMDDKGNASEEDAAIRVVILPPWWRTTWAYTLYGLFFIAVVYAIDRLQRRRVLRTERERVRERELQQAREIERAYDELKKTQQQLMTQVKLASLGQITAGIAHEIKNPLNFVNNFAVLTTNLTNELREVMEAHKDKFDTAAHGNVREVLQLLDQNVAKISEHGKRADNIVKDMLLHSRGESSERRAAIVNDILDEYVMLAFHSMRGTDSTFNIRIEKDYDPTIGRVVVFPQDLSRAFLNLVNNACYATHDKKKALGDGYAPALSVATKNLGNKIEIRIRDNGNGIPPDIRERIFNPFFTTKPAGQGTGLGLSISYDIIVQEHQGEIEVKTEEGKFTEFVVILPRGA